MKIFNFELEEKLDPRFYVKCDGESNGDSPEAQKPYLIDPAPLGIEIEELHEH